MLPILILIASLITLLAKVGHQLFKKTETQEVHIVVEREEQKGDEDGSD